MLLSLWTRCQNWTRLLRAEVPTLPTYWKRAVVNGLLAALPDDEIAAILRAKMLSTFGFRVGKGAMVRQGVRLGGSRLRIGAYASIGACSHLDCHDEEIVIDDHVVLSPKVTIVTASHLLDGFPGRIGATVGKPVHIKDGAWICVGATILPGVTVGERSVIAAGSVVSHDVPDNTVVGGIPARVIKTLDDEADRLERGNEE